MKYKLSALSSVLSAVLSGKSLRISHSLEARSSKPTARLQRGFTLIELLVVVGIIVFISALILANTNKFGGQTLLQNLAYDIALSVREAQVYGISVQENTSGTFSTGYGMHFALSDSTHYTLFQDIAQTGVYPNALDVKPTIYTIGQSFQISKLCVTPVSGIQDCSPTSLDVLFIRPEPDACISANGATDVTTGTAYACASTNQSACVIVTSPRGGYMNVLIYSNGQISVETDSTNGVSC
jgi:prepilin-type N-terminal cleavage/methylation domain-containing protein